MSTAIYVGGSGKKKIHVRFSHLNQHYAISCEYQQRYGVVRTAIVFFVSYIFNKTEVENHMFSRLQFPRVLNSFIWKICKATLL